MQSISLLGWGGKGVNTDLPKAIAELQGLTISGPLTGAASGTAIALTGIDLGDTVVKALMQDGTTAQITDVTSNLSVVDRRAQGTLTLSGVVAGDKVAVNGKTYTFVAAPNFATNLTPRQVAVGATDTATAANLVKSIMSADSTLFASSNAAVVTVYARALGTSGNAITLDVSLSNAHITKSGATLAGGTATQGVVLNTNTTSNKLFVIWFNNPNVPHA